MKTMILTLSFLAGITISGVSGEATSPEPATDTAGDSPSPKTAAEFKVLGMACGACAKNATDLLEKIPRVQEANVDFDSKNARVQADGAVTREQIRQALSAFGFEAQFPGEKLDELQPLSEEVRATLDIRTLSGGKKIRIKDHLSPGKIIIFDFYAEWCGPCHLLSPRLERLVRRYPEAALRKVDLIDWKTPVARQATREFKLPGLPFTVIFDDRGKEVGRVQGNFIEKIEAIVLQHKDKK